jgi:hypothetical protein
MALGEIYNLTKRVNDGSRGNQHTEAGAKVAPATKPPKTAKAIADKAGVSRRPITRITTITGPP